MGFRGALRAAVYFDRRSVTSSAVTDRQERVVVAPLNSGPRRSDYAGITLARRTGSDYRPYKLHKQLSTVQRRFGLGVGIFEANTKKVPHVQLAYPAVRKGPGSQGMSAK